MNFSGVVSEIDPVTTRVVRCTITGKNDTLTVDINKEAFPVALGDKLTISTSTGKYQANYIRLTQSTHSTVASCGGLLMEYVGSTALPSEFSVFFSKEGTSHSKKARIH